MKIRMRQGYMQQFRTIKGIREGMMSPLLFNLYIADIDNELEKRRIGRVRLGRDRTWWSLAYVDNLIFIAYNRELLQDMMSTNKIFGGEEIGAVHRKVENNEVWRKREKKKREMEMGK